ncbi:hypothetical protein EAVNNN508_00032 [Elizabethkingia anophelis]|nr:hypothetical protein EAVNVB490_01106 [Elizabethkingia anophelis]CAH1146986.1 hypothetical protein EAVVTKC53_02243 [Elizabethkingia anophelis]CAI9669936.1 hypothetical protein EAVNNN508_01106 [Elizabethkingia anophelis]CAI9672673.1 hypothetical protein EAVNVB490_00032 [Elizabethkingia anophelis]CAI9676540.1 hypothetical protein EAVNNN508_00032 [Elizabethkingia anophelis]
MYYVQQHYKKLTNITVHGTFYNVLFTKKYKYEHN